MNHKRIEPAWRKQALKTTPPGARGFSAWMMAQMDTAGVVFLSNPPNMAPLGSKATNVRNDLMGSLL